LQKSLAESPSGSGDQLASCLMGEGGEELMNSGYQRVDVLVQSVGNYQRLEQLARIRQR